MAEKLDPKEVVTLEELAISNMWEIAAIVKLLQRKGLCTKQDLHAIINNLRRGKSRARMPESVFPEPYLLTETENKLIQQILDLFNEQSLTAHQAKVVLARRERLIDIGEKLVSKTTH